MSIRPALPSDARAAARLIQAVFDTLSIHLKSAERSEDNPARYAWLEEWFRQENNRYSYQQVLVKEVEGQVVGLVLFYHGSEAEALDRPINERLRLLRNDPTITLEQEADLDEFYIDTLSVDPAFSRRGYGTALIQATEEYAQAHHYNKIAISVDEDNEGAYRLYQRLGYKMEKEWMLYGTRYFHVVKYLDVGS